MRCDRHEEVVEDLKCHDARIDSLEKQNVGISKDIQSLCSKLADLSSSIKWLIYTVAGTCISGILGIVFLIIKKGLNL